MSAGQSLYDATSSLQFLTELDMTQGKRKGVTFWNFACRDLVEISLI